MAKTYGWAGKILRVDLTKGTVKTEDTAKYVPEYIGGKGVATRIAWNELKPGVKAYDPENLLMFMTGPFAGTLAPTGGRGIVCAVSPRSYPIEWFTYSGMGGHWTAELKYAGFDGVVVKGNSRKPVYLWINDGKAEIKDAEKLWGLGTFATQTKLKAEQGDQTQVICIGPGGENKVLYATVQHKLSNAAGNAGFGAVMGAKKLKAIAIRGTGGVKVANPAQFISACKEVADLISAGPTFNPIGGPPGPGSLPCSHGCPLGCTSMRKGDPAGLEVGSGTRNMMKHCVDPMYTWGWDRTEYPTKFIKKEYTGDIFTRPTKGFGDDIGSELQTIGEGLGISGWNYVNNYVWVSACVDNGIAELNGHKLEPDKPEFWHDLLYKIAYREGIGDILADDLIRACERLNMPEKIKKIALWSEPMWGFGTHRIGRGAESQPSPIWIYTMCHWITDSRDPLQSHHQSSFVEYWFPPHHGAGSPDTDFKKLKATYARVFGTGEVMEPGFGHIKEKTEAAAYLGDRANLKDSLLVCDWCFPRLLSGFMSKDELTAATDYYGDLDAETKMFVPLTGLNMSTADLEKAGERVRNLDRALHVRNYDRTREMDSTAEWVFEYPEKSDGSKLDKAMFNKIVDYFYEARGWDKKTGWPTRAKLEKLGLKDVADELAGIGRLP